MKLKRIVMFVMLGIAITVLAACVRWHGEHEYYFGPVLYRSLTPDTGKAYVGQVLRLGIWADVGINWGLMAGFSDRVIVDPKVVSVKRGRLASRDSWLAPISVPIAHDDSLWRFSPFYLDAGSRESTYFLSQTLEGAEFSIGQDTNNLSLGYIRKTLFKPPDNAITNLRYRDDRPLQTEASVWLDVTQSEEISSDLIKEAAP